MTVKEKAYLKDIVETNYRTIETIKKTSGMSDDYKNGMIAGIELAVELLEGYIGK